MHKIWSDIRDPYERVRACFCIGPQNGEPRCPCRMRHIKIQDGRYVVPERDIGPVSRSALGGI